MHRIKKGADAGCLISRLGGASGPDGEIKRLNVCRDWDRSYADTIISLVEVEHAWFVWHGWCGPVVVEASKWLPHARGVYSALSPGFGGFAINALHMLGNILHRE